MLKLPIYEPNKKNCLFDMLGHKVHGEKLNQPNPNRIREIKNYKYYEREGLTNCQYEVREKRFCKLFSHFLVDLFAPNGLKG